VVVLGGFGFFGGAIVDALRETGLEPLVGSRRTGADVEVDVEDTASLRGALREGDLIVDAVGPFQRRSTKLVEAALEIGCDVIDIADSFDYVAAVYRLRERIEEANVRVLTACSAMSTVSATMVERSGIAEPVSITGILVPATRHSAVAGTAASLFCSVGRTIQVLADGRLVQRAGWREKRSFALPEPVGRRVGRLFESADAITLPAVWRSLQSIEFYVDTNVRGLNTALDLAARSAWLRGIVDRLQAPGVKLSRLLGREASGLGYEIVGRDGQTARLSLTAPRRGFLMAVLPAVLAARRIATGEFSDRGLVSPERHVPADSLFATLAERGIQLNIARAHCRVKK
jgi:hypothetical protein